MIPIGSSANRLRNALIAISVSLSIAGCGGGETQPRTGYVVDAPIEGMAYSCGRLTGTTGSDGSFLYDSGTACSFTVGNVMVGAISNVPPDGIVTPYDLAGVSRTDALHANAIAIAQFLQSLDDGTRSTHINISTTVFANLSAIAPTSIVSSALTPRETQVQLYTLVATGTRGAKSLVSAEVAVANLNSYLQTALPNLDRTAGVVLPNATISSAGAPKLAAALPATLTAVNARVGFSVTSDVDAIGYWVVLPASDGSPNEWQVISGLNAKNATAALAGHGNMAAGSTASFEVSGLDYGTSYLLYFVAINARATARVTQVASSSITIGFAPPAPNLSPESIAPIDSVDGTAVFAITSDVTGTGYWVVLPSGAAPSATQIVAGTDSANAAASIRGSIQMTGGSAANVSVSGMTYSTSYTLYFAATNLSDTMKISSILSVPIVTGPPPIINPVVKFKSLSAGDFHTLAVKTDGTLWGWGENSKGQIGDGTTANKSQPVQIGKDSNWAEAAAGDILSVAVRTDGTLWVWGYNQDGELGDGTTINKSAPVQIGKSANWTRVYSGGYHSFAANRDGTLWGWGQNGSGQLGDGTTVLRNSPVQIGNDEDWAVVSAGDIFTVAIKTNGTLWAWGNNPYGQLGDGTTASRIVPGQIGSDSNWTTVSAGTGHTVAIKTDGTLWGWGANADGQLGDGTTLGKTAPVKIGSDANWARVYAGVRHTMAVKTDGTLWVWGDNNVYCQLADPVLEDKLVPFQVDSNANWTTMAAGWGHSVAVRADGTLWTWGNNEKNQLGNGTTDAKCRPIQIGE